MIQISALSKKSIIGIAVATVVGIGIIAFFHHLSKVVDQRLQQGVFADSYSVYSAPKKIVVGDLYSTDALTSYLLKIGYSTSSTNPVGYFSARDQYLEVFPGKPSPYHDDPIRIGFTGGKITELRRLNRSVTVDPVLAGSTADHQLEQPGA